MRVMEVGIHEAKTNFSELLRRVATGEDVVITRSGVPIARLVPFEVKRTRRLGTDAGKVTFRSDFDDPLDDEMLASFES